MGSVRRIFKQEPMGPKIGRQVPFSQISVHGIILIIIIIIYSTANGFLLADGGRTITKHNTIKKIELLL
jgi:archaellum biogenesis protein FlaJ (TadC family)